MAKTITLKYSGYCHECAAPLPVGTRAKGYGRGKVYGVECHAPRRPQRDPEAVLAERERAQFEHEYAMGVQDAHQMKWLRENMGQQYADQYEHDQYWKYGIE